MGKKIRVDDIDYDLDNLSDKAKASLIYLEFTNYSSPRVNKYEGFVKTGSL